MNEPLENAEMDKTSEHLPNVTCKKNSRTNLLNHLLNPFSTFLLSTLLMEFDEGHYCNYEGSCIYMKIWGIFCSLYQRYDTYHKLYALIHRFYLEIFVLLKGSKMLQNGLESFVTVPSFHSFTKRERARLLSNRTMVTWDLAGLKKIYEK